MWKITQIRDQHLGNISEMFDQLNVREGNETLNQLIQAKDQSSKLQSSLEAMYTQNLFANVCQREIQVQAYSKSIELMSLMAHSCAQIQHSKQIKLDSLGTSVKSVVNRCRKDTVDRLSALQKDLI